MAMINSWLWSLIIIKSYVNNQKLGFRWCWVLKSQNWGLKNFAYVLNFRYLSYYHYKSINLIWIWNYKYFLLSFKKTRFKKFLILNLLLLQEKTWPFRLNILSHAVDETCTLKYLLDNSAKLGKIIFNKMEKK